MERWRYECENSGTDPFTFTEPLTERPVAGRQPGGGFLAAGRGQRQGQIVQR
jgi:hypothetical protein